MHRFEVRVGPVPPPSIPLEGARVQRGQDHQDTEAHGATLGGLRCNKDGKRPQPIQIDVAAESKPSLKATPQGAGRLQRRSDVMSEFNGKRT